MKVKTSELQGAALDGAVAKCEGKDGDCEIHAGNIWYGRVTSGFTRYHPSTNRDQGHEILEREGISVAKVGRSLDDAMAPHPDCWCAHIDGVFAVYGPTPLVAGMRCYVASKLGNEVDVPDELTV